MTDTAATTTPYELLGGEQGIHQLVSRFYVLMDELPEAYVVRQIHPESLSGSAESLFEFLSGWLGGPPLYETKKGHPRLRMRHMPYAISPQMRDEWMLCMRQAIAEQVQLPEFRQWLTDSIAKLADHMVNTEGQAACTHSH
jgi:hemoglobin